LIAGLTSKMDKVQCNISPTETRRKCK